MQPKVVSIQNLRAARIGGSHRVMAEVAGHNVWFESQELSLRASCEAFGSALLIPALYNGARMRLDPPVCPTWQKGMREVVPLLNRWWQLPLLLPETKPLAAPLKPV